MKTINSFINERLKITKDSKSTTIDIHELIKNIIFHYTGFDDFYKEESEEKTDILDSIEKWINDYNITEIKTVMFIDVPSELLNNIDLTKYKVNTIIADHKSKLYNNFARTIHRVGKEYMAANDVYESMDIMGNKNGLCIIVYDTEIAFMTKEIKE